jgi:hypothetical protein
MSDSYNFYADELTKVIYPSNSDEELQLKIISDRFTTKWLTLNEESIPIIIQKLQEQLIKLKK